MSDPFSEEKNQGAVGVCHTLATVGGAIPGAMIGKLPGLLVGAAAGYVAGLGLCGNSSNMGPASKAIKNRFFTNGQVGRLNQSVNHQLGMKVSDKDVRSMIKAAASAPPQKPLSLPHARAKSVWLRAKYGSQES